MSSSTVGRLRRRPEGGTHNRGHQPRGAQIGRKGGWIRTLVATTMKMVFRCGENLFLELRIVTVPRSYKYYLQCQVTLKTHFQGVGHAGPNSNFFLSGLLILYFVLDCANHRTRRFQLFIMTIFEMFTVY